MNTPRFASPDTGPKEPANLRAAVLDAALPKAWGPTLEVTNAPVDVMAPTPKEDKVPSEVMLVWATVDRVPTRAVSAVIVPPSMLEEPTSIFPNPLVIEPPLRAPVEVSELVTTVDLSSVPVSEPAAAAPGADQDGTPEASVSTSVSEPLASLANVVVPLA